MVEWLGIPAGRVDGRAVRDLVARLRLACDAVGQTRGPDHCNACPPWNWDTVRLLKGAFASFLAQAHALEAFQEQVFAKVGEGAGAVSNFGRASHAALPISIQRRQKEHGGDRREWSALPSSCLRLAQPRRVVSKIQVLRACCQALTALAACSQLVGLSLSWRPDGLGPSVQVRLLVSRLPSWDAGCLLPITALILSPCIPQEEHVSTGGSRGAGPVSRKAPPQPEQSENRILAANSHYYGRAISGSQGLVIAACEPRYSCHSCRVVLGGIILSAMARVIASQPTLWPGSRFHPTWWAAG